MNGPHPTTVPRGQDGQRTFVLEDAIETVYDRPDTHGEPEDSFASIAAVWNGYLRAIGVEQRLDEVDVAHLMIGLKMARNIEGHYHADNWEDIAGYAENGARLQRRRDFECPNCEASNGIEPSDSYCGSCGAELPDDR